MTEKNWKFAFGVLTMVTVGPIGTTYWLTKVADSKSDIFFGASIVVLVLLSVALFFFVQRLPMKFGAILALFDLGLVAYVLIRFVALFK